MRCPRCHADCRFSNIQATCSRGHRFTVLVGTVFGKKRRPSVRALLLAIRAMGATHRGTSARELARDVGMNHVTLWRHLHTLRALLPKPSAVPTSTAANVQLTGRHSRARRSWGRVGARNAMCRDLRPRAAPPRARILGESVRTWLAGTFHGVSASWLPFYLREISAR